MKNPKRSIFLRSRPTGSKVRGLTQGQALVGRDLASRRAGRTGRTGLVMRWLLRPLAPALAALALSPPAPAQTPPITSGTHVFADSTTFDSPARQSFTTLLTPAWLIADDATVTIANATATANGGVFEMNTNNSTVFTIAPSGSTGRVVFRNNITSAEGGVFWQNRNTLNITNASFIGNGSTKTSAHGGGALRIGSTAIATSLANVLFDKNYALSLGGAIRTLHGLSITSGTFTGNYAAGVGTANTIGYGGAIAAYAGGLTLAVNGVQQSVVRESYFAGNWASRYGGAIGLDTLGYHSFNFFDHAGFADNFAGVAGGAFYDYANTALLVGGAPCIDGQRFVFTGTTGVTAYVYSGNIARGAAMTADEIALARSGSFAFTATAAAKAGGFYFSGTAGTRLRFDIAEGVTVAIGAAGNPSAWDSIANSDASGTTARIDLVETGTAVAPGGTLILHADNSYFQGSVNVEKGALLLGNQNAGLGGVITVASGATFGGAGALVTHKQDDSVFAGRTKLVLGDNARLLVGTGDAIDAETLTVAGDLAAGAGVTFEHDLFSSGSASLLCVENLSLAGTGTVNLGMLATGSFALIEWAGDGLGAADLDRLTLTVDGVAGNLRSPAELSLSGSRLIVTTTVNNLALRWTGAEGAIWTSRASGAQRNWDAAGSDENRFFNADTVAFDGVADAAGAANREIVIATVGVVVSGMEVSGTARYVFRGEGGITADAGAVGSSAFTPTGKLKKSGAGELVFANTAPNNFAGGIEIAGGAVTFNRAAQLGSGTGGIVFSDSGTLRAISSVSGTLTGGMGVAPGKTATLEIEPGGALVYDGALAVAADATLRKTGAGALLLAGDSSAGAGAFALDAGVVTLATPATALGGKITVASGATLGGVGAAGAGGFVTLAAGGILEAGLDSAQSGTLTVNNLTLAGGALLRLDLFKDSDDVPGYQKSDRVIGTGASAISGANTIDLTSFASGTFNLGNLTGLAAAGRVTLSGMTLPAGIGVRLTAELTDDSGVLKLVTTADQSREMAWTGGGGSTWNLAEADWTDGGAVNQFGYGDRVRFDDTAAAGRRDILIGAGEVRVADMTVGGAADYTFTGGGIHASADNVQPDALGVAHITDATGKLIKTGSGMLTLANAANHFAGGVQIDGGVLAISRGDQLTTGTARMDFTGDATLRANAGLALDNEILVASGNTAVVDTNGHDVVLRGRVSVAQDAAFVKEGGGVALFEQQLAMNATGAFAVRGGTARAGAENVFTVVEGAAIVVEEGALLDFNGHSQTLSNLSGAGGVDISGAQLTYNAASGAHTFAGSFAGSGTIRKLGDGKWTLSGSSSFDGDFLVNAGALGLGDSAALGAAAITFNGPSGGALSIEAGGLDIANDIAVSGPATLTLDTNGRAAEFSGGITASSLAIAGAGTLSLSGNNTISALAINNPLAIARRAEAIGNAAVSIADGSTLEFRDIGFGQVNGNLTGDRVLLASSTMSLRGANSLRALDIAAGSRVTAASTGALGGAGANVTVRDGAWLMVPTLGTVAGNMSVDGGALVFGAAPAPGSLVIYGTPGSLALSGTLGFSNGGEIRLGTTLTTGIYTAAVAYGGITGAPAYDANQGGMFMVADIVGGDTLRITAYNKALEPGKDIVVAFDALSASMRAVSTHISEEFISPLAGRKVPRGGNSLWVRAIGSFMEYGDDRGHLGYTDNTCTGIIGYDWLSTKALMLGGYFGYSNTRLETNNNATTDIDVPRVGLYAARRLGDFYLSADLTAGHGSADTRRREDFGNLVTGSHKLDTLGGTLEIGYALPILSDGEIRPSAGIHYMNLSFHDYAETGKGAVRLDDIRASLLQGVVRIDAGKGITLPWGLPGMVSLGAGWRQNFLNERTDAWATLVEYPNARIQIRGDEYAKNSFIASLGIRMMLSKSMLFSLAYDYDCVPFGDQNNGTGRHTFDSVLRISW